MKEKLWPSIARIAHENKLSTQVLIEQIHEKICEEFVTEVIIQNTNEISVQAAATLWQSLERNEIDLRKEYNQIDIQSYSNLMETLNLLLIDDTMQVLFYYI